MNQPPNPDVPPQWRRPRGVAAGTWDYVNERSIADHYDAFVADTPLCRLDANFVNELFPDVEPRRDVSILDLGCGSGRIAIELAAAGYRVIGVDLSQPMLRVLAGKVAGLPSGSGSVTAVRANLVELECFANCAVDHAVCLFATFGMIQGRGNRRRMLGHVARIVRPGGRLVIHVHNIMAALREPGGTVALLRSAARSLFDRDHQWGDACYAYRGIENMFMHRFTRRELQSDLQAAGWAVEQIESISIDGARRTKAGRIAGGFIAVASRPNL